MIYTETIVNVDRRAQLGYSGPIRYGRSVRDLFRMLVGLWGRCSGKVYRDTKEGVKAVGWVFEKRIRLEERNGSVLRNARYYLQETWVELFEEILTGGEEEE